MTSSNDLLGGVMDIFGYSPPLDRATSLPLLLAQIPLQV